MRGKGNGDLMNEDARGRERVCERESLVAVNQTLSLYYICPPLLISLFQAWLSTHREGEGYEKAAARNYPLHGSRFERH